jgi:hypothetical protein
MVLNKNKTYKNLKKKGFVDSVNRSEDHKYLEYFVGGKLILYTKISHGSGKDLEDYLIKQMSNQCKLTKQQFADLVNCPLSSDAYLQILKENGELE